MDDSLLNQIYEKVGTIEGKLDSYHQQATDIQTRVVKLEGQWAKLLGMFTVITFPFTALWAYLKTKHK